MKKIIFFIILIFIGGFIYLLANHSPKANPISETNNINQNKTNPDDVPRVSVVAENLDTPWGLVFLPDNSVLATERKGTIRKIDPNGNLEENPVAEIINVKEISEGGLLGIDIHPDFKSNGYVYLYYTYNGSGNRTSNRVSRFKYENNALKNEEIIVDNIPGAPNHNGGRIKFGPDKYLYIGTGDAQEPSLAQNTYSLAGKILRVDDKGNPHPQNPFGNRVFSFGHRNVQGLSWDNEGNLWATEHGRSGVTSGFDELNLIRTGQNYGWPDFEGNETASGIIPPVINSGANDTWAPSGAAILNNSIFFAGLRGTSLYQATLNGENAVNLKEHFSGEFGRLRDVVKGPDNMLYITTSNRDGRGIPAENDDKIIRINVSKL